MISQFFKQFYNTEYLPKITPGHRFVSGRKLVCYVTSKAYKLKSDSAVSWSCTCFIALGEGDAPTDFSIEVTFVYVCCRWNSKTSVLLKSAFQTTPCHKDTKSITARRKMASFIRSFRNQEEMRRLTFSTSILWLVRFNFVPRIS